MSHKCECQCEACKSCTRKQKEVKRFITWGMVSSEHFVGYDQWGEKWDVDGRTLNNGAAMLMKKDGPNAEIIEFFPNIGDAKEAAEYINQKRGNWHER